jgi:hypothetical protein
MQIIACTGAVLLAVAGPCLVQDEPALYRNIVGYSGVNDQGFGGLLRALWLHHAHNFYLPGSFGPDFSATTRWLTLALVALTLALLRGQPLARIAAGVYLAFLSAYGGVSSQYLVWPLAWLLLGDLSLRWSVLYALGTAAGVVGFYAVYWPQLLSGHASDPVMGNSGQYIAGQCASLAAIWGCFGALWPTLRRKVFRKPAVQATSLLVLASSVPVARLVGSLVQSWRNFRT